MVPTELPCFPPLPRVILATLAFPYSQRNCRLSEPGKPLPCPSAAVHRHPPHLTALLFAPSFHIPPNTQASRQCVTFSLKSHRTLDPPQLQAGFIASSTRFPPFPLSPHPYFCSPPRNLTMYVLPPLRITHSTMFVTIHVPCLHQTFLSSALSLVLLSIPRGLRIKEVSFHRFGVSLNISPTRPPLPSLPTPFQIQKFEIHDLPL